MKLAVHHSSLHHSSPFMKSAISQAQSAAARGEVPVGAVIVREGKIIASSGNQALADHDPTAHAEMLAIRSACTMIQNERLIDCDMYVTLEPCPMCAAAISFARIRRLYFGAYDAKSGGVENGARIFAQSSCHHVPEVYGGIAESECAQLLKDFFVARRVGV